jgi:choline dehydrogenase-like flavoprotein
VTAAEVSGSDVYDFVVVGSGAGGGPVAANLAEAGHRVLLLEAGLDAPDDDYRVPAFHGRASEHPGMSRPFFVRHFDDRAQQQRGTPGIRARPGLGTSRLVHRRDRPAHAGRRAGRELARARHPWAADPRLLHRDRHLHGGGEGQRRDPRRLRPPTVGVPLLPRPRRPLRPTPVQETR